MIERTVRRIAVVTVGRSDFSILLPLCRKLAAAGDIELSLWAGGAHFDPVGGMTIRDIEESGLTIDARVATSCYEHSASGAAQVMAAQLAGFGQAAAKAIAAGRRPDLVLILGDRYEAIAAGLAMVPFQIPIGHLSGGSITEGAMDDMFRHALTKLAALHFCDLPEFARRIHQMGEEPWRIFTVGALGLDGIHARPIEPLEGLREKFGLTGLRPRYVLATLHPETQAPARTPEMVRAMIEALSEGGQQVVLTYPNADPGSDAIIAAIEDSAKRDPRHHVVRNFGSAWLYSALAHAGLVVGNSSMGIYEAASFGLPVVDIGDRQKNRFRGENVVHADASAPAIVEAMQAAEALRSRLPSMANPYGDGRGAERVMEALRGLDWAAVASPKLFVTQDQNFAGDRMELPCN